MAHNDVLRSLRYALRLSDEGMVEIFALAKPLTPGLPEVTVAEVRALLAKDDEEDALECSEDRLRLFLDGLILQKRGPPPTDEPRQVRPLVNNEILKKLRIAFALVEADILDILNAAEQPMSKGELSALFRTPGHKHFRVCGDQVLRKFLRGLTLRLQGAHTH